MQAILSLVMGYFIGCINPAAWVGKKKQINLKEKGTEYNILEHFAYVSNLKI